jgi:hypothetical protein
MGHIGLFLKLVLQAAASLRCASRSMGIVFETLSRSSLSMPSWYAGRLWLMRLGYYKLHRVKKQGRDWVWIVDHSVQIGIEKCLVILGVRLSQLSRDSMCLNHEDVEPITLEPVKKSNGEIVYEQLEEAVKKTGVPREIVGDYGSDLKSGVERFCQNHSETCFIYDIKHKSASLLKKLFEFDNVWQEFIRLTNETKQKVQQTALAYLAPPNQKTKSRYMNIDILIKWAKKMLTFLQEGLQHNGDAEQIKEKIGWLLNFEEAIFNWNEILTVTQVTESFVRTKGFFAGSALQLKELLGVGGSEDVQKIREAFIAFVTEQSEYVHENECLVGSSEVIESVFGKLKRLEQSQSKSGFTSFVLSVGALVATTTNDIIEKALQAVPTKNVFDWGKKILGPSVQSKRKKALCSIIKTEQKLDQLQMAM